MAADCTSKILIGNGTGSTTLLPNSVRTEFGNFLDLAGDFDSRGIVGEIFNNFWKSLIQLKGCKVLMMVPESNFTAMGGNGKLFK